MKLCVIPARGGSKRIPRKNIKNFCGQPMIGYSIKAALATNYFDHVVVSTDDEEIADVAESLGASVPFKRPEELSNDFAATLPVIKHAIDWFENNGLSPTEVCCLYATAPFVQSTALKDAHKQMLASKAEYCFSVTSFAFPIQRAIKINEEQRVEMFFPENFSIRSQDLEEAYHDAGQFYWGKTDAWKQEKPFFSDVASPFILPRYLVQDIDTLEDWRRAELMFNVLKQQGLM